MDKGFHNADGQPTISLDSFNDNLGAAGLYKMGNDILGHGQYRHGKDMVDGWNMIFGMYGGMVVWEWTLDSKVNGTGLNGAPDYKWRDCALKVNGEVCSYGGSQAMFIDPTHPAVRANLEYEFAKYARNNVKYVKMDFLTAAAHEGDSWYNPDITTGIEAYNYGMAIVRELAEKYDMYIVEAMAPLFPYEYAHGRRTCCDRWGRLEESEFVMNAISYGWWTDRLYTVNDPDQMTFHQCGHNASETLGENRVRATSGMTTGAYLFGENFSDRCTYTDTKDGHTKGQVVGYPSQSRERALIIMGNEDVNAYVRENLGSFMPVEGNDPSYKQEAESLFFRETPQYWYVAVFNWSAAREKKGTVTWERLGIDPSQVGDVKELWSGEAVTPAADGLEYTAPGGDVLVYRISRNDYVGIGETREDLAEEAGTGIKATIEGNLCTVSASEALSRVEVYNMAGALVAAESVSGTEARLSGAFAPGIYAIRCTMADGTVSGVRSAAR